MDASPALGPTRRRWIPIVYVILVVAVLLVGIVAYRSVKDTLDCSPPSHGKLKSQEAFVRAHVADVTVVELGTYDCDDNGDGYVSFTTRLSPSTRDAFRADQACLWAGQDDGDTAVSCTSDKSDVYVSFEMEDGETRGVLNFS